MNYKIIGKYVKELTFNIPNPKTFFLLSKDIANYKINIDIKSTQIKQNIIEILTTLNLTPTSSDFEKIDTRIIYSTIAELDSERIEKSEMEEFLWNVLDGQMNLCLKLRGQEKESAFKTLANQGQEFF